MENDGHVRCHNVIRSHFRHTKVRFREHISICLCVCASDRYPYVENAFVCGCCYYLFWLNQSKIGASLLNGWFCSRSCPIRCDFHVNNLSIESLFVLLLLLLASSIHLNERNGRYQYIWHINFHFNSFIHAFEFRISKNIFRYAELFIYPKLKQKCGIENSIESQTPIHLKKNRMRIWMTTI